ncbi:MAG TPA: hypothetical protein VKE69_09670 [Planctomycetota bacterium]|nr:hypothetical protein [Planctomycetota bacterium]
MADAHEELPDGAEGASPNVVKSAVPPMTKVDREAADLFDWLADANAPGGTAAPVTAPSAAAPPAPEGAAIQAAAPAATPEAAPEPAPAATRRWSRTRVIVSAVAAILVVDVVVAAVLLRRHPSSTEPAPETAVAQVDSKPAPPEAAPPSESRPVAPPVAAPPRVAARPNAAALDPVLASAEELFTRGSFSEARSRYFQALLSPPVGDESAEVERIARLRIAQCLAREAAPADAPIQARPGGALR